ncbi:uncharacterized protein AB675_2169 [Cyphellophora attinorum]|uniref:Conidiation-specific protein 6 n=1 Tax=Cyphellophora attinorum TaxID=1664694 RepID=A0A0N1HXV0_9EURO|nr:uncharacterized protein AB675_2169 [Phialophora attinorum]KPI42945.1 hypothetical protein AB675_2169 [Phialophora attinorum]
MAASLRSKLDLSPEAQEERVLGDKAVGGIDNDADHLANVRGGLKAAISNPNTSNKAKREAEEKLAMLDERKKEGSPTA